MTGATIFWIAGITALPPIYNRLTSTTAQNCVYWLPQVIGGSGFIISGTLFMLETQKKWYLPAPKVLGWHIAVWNLIGVCFLGLFGRDLIANNRPGNWLHALRSAGVCQCKQRSCVRGESWYVPESGEHV
jgi:hypothetical protein